MMAHVYLTICLIFYSFFESHTNDLTDDDDFRKICDSKFSDEPCDCLGNAVYCDKLLQSRIKWHWFPNWTETIILRKIKFDMGTGINDTHLSFPLLSKLKQLTITHGEGVTAHLIAFLTKKLPALQTFRISNSRLAETPVFNVLHNLIKLILSRNQLSEINSKTLESLPLLTELDISHNQFLHLNHTWFPVHNRLEILIISNCKISSLSPLLGRVLTHLRVLKLNHNNLHQLKSYHYPLQAINLCSPPSSHLTNSKISIFSCLPSFLSVQHLDVSDNNIGTIESSTFENWKSLRELILFNCNITTIAANAFYRLSTLEILILGYNKGLKRVSNKWMMGLTSLQNLDVSNCGIVEVEPLSDVKSLIYLNLSNNNLVTLKREVFSELSSLKYLRLDSNQLSSVENGVLTGLVKLIALDLNNNSVTYFDIDNIAQLPSLRHLNLFSNQSINLQSSSSQFTRLLQLQEFIIDHVIVDCHCGIISILNWIKLQELGDKITCKSPHKLVTKSLQVLSISDFEDCAVMSNFQFSVSLVGPGIVSVFIGDPVTLMCKITVVFNQESVPIQSSIVQWQKVDEYGHKLFVSADKIKIEKENVGKLDSNITDNGIVDIISSPNFEGNQLSFTQEKVQTWISKVQFDQVGFSDAAVYNCIVQASFIVDTSPAVELKVKVAPRFSSAPKETIIATVGKSISIPCFATGYPKPDNSLRKKGTKEFMQAALDRRFQAPQDDIYFVISNVTLKDMGEYICESKSEAGHIYAEFKLIVHAPPIFNHHSAEFTVLQTRQQEKLECFVTGFPTVFIKWLKNGEPIQFNENIYLAQQNQSLHFQIVNYSDGGEYTCIASNMIGLQQLRISVTVQNQTSELKMQRTIHSQSLQDMQSGKLSNSKDMIITIIIITVTLCCLVFCAVLCVNIWCHIQRRKRKKQLEKKDFLTQLINNNFASTSTAATKLCDMEINHAERSLLKSIPIHDDHNYFLIQRPYCLPAFMSNYCITDLSKSTTDDINNCAPMINDGRFSHRSKNELHFNNIPPTVCFPHRTQCLDTLVILHNQEHANSTEHYDNADSLWQKEFCYEQQRQCDINQLRPSDSDVNTTVFYTISDNSEQNFQTSDYHSGSVSSENTAAHV